MTAPNPTLSQSVRATLMQKIVDKGVHPERAAERVDDKMTATRKWWIRAGICFALAIAFLIVALYVIARIALETHTVGVVVCVALATPSLLLTAAAVFCASFADPETTHETLNTILSFGHGVRDLGGGA